MLLNYSMISAMKLLSFLLFLSVLEAKPLLTHFSPMLGQKSILLYLISVLSLLV